MALDPYDSWWLWTADVAAFARDCLDFEPDPVQERLLNCADPEIMLLCCRQWGKTTVSSARAAHHVIFTPKALALVVSATQRQASILQKRALDNVRRVQRKVDDWKVKADYELPEDPLDANSKITRQSVMSLELSNGSEIISAPASPETIRGYSPTLIIVDEAARVPDAVHDAVGPMRGYTGAQLLMCTSAAGQRGFFYQQWVSDVAGWTKMEVKAEECPRLAKEFLAREKVLRTRPIYAQEYENEFLSPEGSLFTLEDIRAAREAGRDLPSFFSRIGDRDASIKPFLGGEQ